MQNSMKGLLCGLVHDILQSCPELVPVAFPIPWQNKLASLNHESGLSISSDVNRLSIGDDQMQGALSNILTHASLSQTHRLCFFIDALDEQIDTSPQNDHKALVDMIHHWAETFQGAVKVCVSSREDNVFTNAFNAERRLRLQELTRQDRENYVLQELPETPSAEIRKRITDLIVNRSCGIFLWVVLVAKALREAFEDGRDFDDFEAELNTLPSELEALFAYLLKTIPASRRKNAYCFFQLMTLHHSNRGLPLHAVLYLDRFLKNPRFALEDSIYPTNLEQLLDRKESNYDDLLLAKARKMLQGDCRGLVETKQNDRSVEIYAVFTHRSVPDFLKKMSTKEAMSEEIRDVSFGEALAQMLLGQIRAADETRADHDPQYGTILPHYLFLALRVYQREKRREYDPNNDYLIVLEEELKRKYLAHPES